MSGIRGERPTIPLTLNLVSSYFEPIGGFENSHRVGGQTLYRSCSSKNLSEEHIMRSKSDTYIRPELSDCCPVSEYDAME